MRENIIQTGSKGTNDRTYIEHDWYSNGIPPNVSLAANVYIDTSYGFDAFHSLEEKGLFIDEASGCYDRASFIVAEEGEVTIGKFSILNGTTIICKNSITVGSHCMLGWGSVITDTWIDENCSVKERREALTRVCQNPYRPYPMPGKALPVVLEDNCWIGFGAVILPGVTLGRGCIVGSKTVVSQNVPSYAIIAGDPPKIVKYLQPDDTEEERLLALKNIA